MTTHNTPKRAFTQKKGASHPRGEWEGVPRKRIIQALFNKRTPKTPPFWPQSMQKRRPIYTETWVNPKPYILDE